jgi:ATP-dependent RNA helicase DeaD
MTEFQNYSLAESLLEKVAALNFTKATPIQQQAIPSVLSGEDVLASSRTGSGKTAAFLLPIITKLLENPKQASLILTPTRELATQIYQTVRDFTAKTSIKHALLIGGEAMPKQLRQLSQKNVQIFVGTPGRVSDHLKRRTFNPKNVSILVLDEMDRMLDMGFTPQIEHINSFMPKERQSLMFSATISKTIEQNAAKYLKNNPKRISIENKETVNPDISQKHIKVDRKEKYAKLVEEINNREGTMIVFVGTKRETDDVALNLRKEGHAADVIHGDLRQHTRNKIIRKFRAQEIRILVATDVAARGLDIDHIKHVINYNVPQVAEDYIHRIGRVGRAGAKGEAVNLISPNEYNKFNDVLRIIDPKAEPYRGGSGNGSSRNSRGRGKKTFSFRDRNRENKFKKNESNRSKFKSHSRRDSSDSDSEYSTKPRSSEGFRKRSPDSRFNKDSSSAGNFKRRSTDSEYSSKPRSSEEFKKRSTDSRFNKDSNSAGNFKRRSTDSESNFKPRSSEGFKKRSTDSRFNKDSNSAGNFKRRSTDSAEYSSKKRSTDSRFNKDSRPNNKSSGDAPPRRASSNDNKKSRSFKGFFSRKSS